MLNFKVKENVFVVNYVLVNIPYNVVLTMKINHVLANTRKLGGLSMKLEETTVIEILRNYMRYKEILQQIQIDFMTIQAYQYSDVPLSVTNKFNSIVENIVMWRQEESHLEKVINLVESWLRFLQNEKRFAIDGYYIQGKTYTQLAREWEKENDILYEWYYWSRKRKEAIRDICKMYEKKTIL